MINPYPRKKGFGLRVYRAEKAIKKLAADPFANIYSRAFDNCFEMGDGDAVVWALMHKAHQEVDPYGQSLLTRGIQEMFRRTLGGQKYPEDWLKVYRNEEPSKDKCQLSFF